VGITAWWQLQHQHGYTPRREAREERILADRKLARSGAQLEQILAACWEETIDAGPYDFGELALAVESGLAPVQGRLAELAALRVRSARAAAATALGDRDGLENDREGVKALLEEALARVPDSAALLAVRAEARREDAALSERIARARAEADLEKALAADPGDASARHERADLAHASTTRWRSSTAWPRRTPRAPARSHARRRCRGAPRDATPRRARWRRRRHDRRVRGFEAAALRASVERLDVQARRRRGKELFGGAPGRSAHCPLATRSRLSTVSMASSGIRRRAARKVAR
jgi:tetratricopeptide (TPR) repeat protein